MILYPICSSSKGNCTYIENEDAAILIDVGISFKRLCKFLSLGGFCVQKIKAIFITHEYTDHVKGLYAATKNLNVPVFSSKLTLKELILKDNIYKDTKLYEINLKTVNVFGLYVSAFKVLHDSVDGVTFKIYDGKKKLIVCTDLGCITKDFVKNFKECDFAFIESNYDVEMLRNGKYPFILKKRIESKFGHLSNLDAAFLIDFLINNGIKRFLLGHLSLNNNLPQIALKTIISYLKNKNKEYLKDYELNVAASNTIGKFYEI